MESIPMRKVSIDGDVTKVEWVDIMSVPEAEQMSKKISPWYQSEFPGDDLGEEISPDVSFQTLYNAVCDGRDVYDVIGVGDSIIRERCFEHLSDIIGLSYNEIYDKWLES